MVFFNLKVDIYNYLVANKRNLFFSCLIVLLGAILGCVFAFGVDLESIAESKDAYFLFLNKTNNSIGGTIFFGIIVHFTLLILAKLCDFTKQIGLVVVFYRAYVTFRRFTLIILAYNFSCVLGVIICAIIEMLICFIFIVVHLINKNIKYCHINELLTDECVGDLIALLIVLVCLGVLESFSYNIIAIFT